MAAPLGEHSITSQERALQAKLCSLGSETLKQAHKGKLFIYQKTHFTPAAQNVENCVVWRFNFLARAWYAFKGLFYKERSYTLVHEETIQTCIKMLNHPLLQPQRAKVALALLSKLRNILPPCEQLKIFTETLSNLTHETKKVQLLEDIGELNSAFSLLFDLAQDIDGFDSTSQITQALPRIIGDLQQIRTILLTVIGINHIKSCLKLITPTLPKTFNNYTQIADHNEPTWTTITQIIESAAKGDMDVLRMIVQQQGKTLEFLENYFRSLRPKNPLFLPPTED